MMSEHQPGNAGAAGPMNGGNGGDKGQSGAAPQGMTGQGEAANSMGGGFAPQAGQAGNVQGAAGHPGMTTGGYAPGLHGMQTGYAPPAMPQGMYYGQPGMPYPGAMPYYHAPYPYPHPPMAPSPMPGAAAMGAAPGQGPNMAEMMQDFADGNGLSSLGKMLNFDDTEFWKGALIGAAAVLLLTNSSVQDALFKGGVKAKDAVKDGVDKVKSRFQDEDPKAEATPKND